MARRVQNDWLDNTCDRCIESVLGQIHLDLAKYHESCRFDTDQMDKEAAVFHLKAAADCGNIQGGFCLLYTSDAADE